MQTQNSTAIGASAANNANSVDQAFEALKTYNWGTDSKVLAPLANAVVAALENAPARAELEKRLAAVLETNAPRDAKDVVCRKLRILGTAACVPSLARLLPDKELSHMARYALERIQDPAAGAALREALPKVNGALKAGVAGSLGARRDAAAVSLLTGLLADGDATVVAAAAAALGEIGTPEAANALSAAVKKAPAAAKPAVIDNSLRAAEGLAAAGKKAEAVAIYRELNGKDLPEHVQMAIQHGLSEA